MLSLAFSFLKRTTNFTANFSVSLRIMTYNKFKEKKTFRCRYEEEGETMSLLKKMRPEQSLKNLRWFDIGIVTLIMFGQFIVRSTEIYLASLAPSVSTAISETSTNTASEGAGYSSNFTLQIILLALAIIYLWIRHFDFKQLPIRLKWSVLFWASFIFAIMDFFADMVSTLSGQYNYFSPQVLDFISPMAVLNKFLAFLPNLWLLSTDCLTVSTRNFSS